LEWKKQSLTTRPEENYSSDKVTYEFTITDKQRDAILLHMKKFSGSGREFQLRKFFDPNFRIKNEYTLLQGIRLDETEAKIELLPIQNTNTGEPSIVNEVIGALNETSR
jgi:hypothetical protein